MAVKGTLRLEDFGFSMPVDAPTYTKPPAVMRDIETISIDYETDAEAAAKLVPAVEGLEIPEPVIARIVFVRFARSPWGGYSEIYQLINCTWQGKPCIFPVRLLVDGNDVGTLVGRELWGNAKKFGHVEFTKESNIIQCTGERPRGSRIVTGLIQPERMLDVSGEDTVDVLGFRVIPNPEDPSKPSLAELLMNTLHVTPIEVWEGPCSLSFTAMSELDPWHKLPIKALGPAIYSFTHMTTSENAKIIWRF